MSAFEVVEAFGTRVIEVSDLPRVVIYLHRYNLALVEADLDQGTQEVAADWLLAEAVSRASA